MWTETEIIGARVFEVALPLLEPFSISGGSMAVRRSLIVELTERSGLRGYGESAPFDRPFYSAETLASARDCLEHLLLPRIVGSRLSHPSEVAEVLAREVRGNRMAMAGPETAWWDLQARLAGRSLTACITERLGELGVDRPPILERVPSGIALGIPGDGSIETLASRVRRAREHGYHRVKVKIRPDWDVDPLQAVRDALPPSTSVMITADANGAYDAVSHRDQLRRIDGLGLGFLEQPFAPDAWWETRSWDRESSTPVCLDESLDSALAARQVVESGGPRIWNLKIQRVGGLDEACRIVRLGRASGRALWVGTMPETGVGARFGLALAACGVADHATDLEPSTRWYAPGVDIVPIAMDRNGTIGTPRWDDDGPNLTGQMPVVTVGE